MVRMGAHGRTALTLRERHHEGERGRVLGREGPCSWGEGKGKGNKGEVLDTHCGPGAAVGKAPVPWELSKGGAHLPLHTHLPDHPPLRNWWNPFGDQFRGHTWIRDERHCSDRSETPAVGQEPDCCHNCSVLADSELNSFAGDDPPR